MLGARITAVDISERLVAIARQKAKVAALDVRFVHADVGALPVDLRSGRFDVTYTGGGVLVWIPDIDIWANIVASTLRQGGTFVLYDGHPVTECMETSDSESSWLATISDVLIIPRPVRVGVIFRVLWTRPTPRWNSSGRSAMSSRRSLAPVW